MNSFFVILSIGFVATVAAKWDGNCAAPPNFPDECCKDSLFNDDVAFVKTCATKFNLPLDAKNEVQVKPENFDSYVCYMDCLFVQENLIKNGTFDMAAVKADIMKSAAAAPDLGTVVYNGFEVCNKALDKLKENAKKTTMADKYFKAACSPNCVLVSDCAALEMYSNCPAKYWSATPECEDLKAYAAKCKPNK